MRGVQDALLLFCLEPPERNFPVQEFTSWASESFAHVVVEASTRHLGCAENTRHAMQRAFDLGAEFAVLAEEDLVVSTDVLEYFAWARDTYRSDGRVKAACAHALRCAPAVSPGLAVLVPWFNPLAWGTWKDRWEGLHVGWALDPQSRLSTNPEGWDHHLRQRLQADELLSVFPGRSRSQHIGEDSTLTGYPLSQYFFKGSVSTCFAPDYPLQAFTEVPRTQELELVV